MNTKRNTKRIAAGLLTMILMAASQSFTVMADTGIMGKLALEQTTEEKGIIAETTDITIKETTKETVAEEAAAVGLTPDYADPDYIKRLWLQENTKETELPQQSLSLRSLSLRSLAGASTKSPFTGLTYIHSTSLQDCEITNGVDVSKWQGDINWEKVKAAGVDFAFIRCGYTSLSSAFAMNADPYFGKNVQGAFDAGIKVGVYYFSNSKTVSEAAKEAQMTLQLISDYRNMITLPVVYDFEAFNASYRAYDITGSKEKVTQNALTYLYAIQDDGYTPMYYSSPSFLENSYDVAQLAEYDCWLANYTTQAIYKGPYIIWQYSSSGKVDGISGNADCNFWYGGQTEESVIREDANGPAQVTGLTMYQNSVTAIRISWNPSPDADGYLIYRSDAYHGDYKLIETIENPSTVRYRDGDFPETAGKQFYYKIVPYQVEMEEDQILYGRESRILTAYLNQRYTYKLKTNTPLNLRSQAGTEFDIVTAVPEGTTLTYPKYTYSNTGKKWYKVSYRKSGKTYVGYLSSSYVTTYMYGGAKLRMGVWTETSTASKCVTRLTQGQKVTITGTKTDDRGKKWAVVQVSQNGRLYRGYCIYNNLKRI